jgi:hypothetical protein
MSAVGERVIASFDSLPMEEKQAVAKEIFRRCPPASFQPASPLVAGLPTAGKAASAERFQRLASTWKEDTRFLSNMDEICSHPAYQEIIGMGLAALPLILAELEREPDNWFWALKAITGEDPVLGQHRGNVRLMKSDWLKWAHLEPAAMTP